MSGRNVVQLTVDQFGQAAGFTKRAGAWYLRQKETISVVELQKSQYGLHYYVNVALWLLPLGEAQYPKEHTCHVRTRLTRLLPEKERRLEALLNLDLPMDELVRGDELRTLLESQLLPIVRTCSSIAGFASPGGERLLKASLVTGPAQQLLQDVAKSQGRRPTGDDRMGK